MPSTGDQFAADLGEVAADAACGHDDCVGGALEIFAAHDRAAEAVDLGVVHVDAVDAVVEEKSEFFARVFVRAQRLHQARDQVTA